MATNEQLAELRARYLFILRAKRVGALAALDVAINSIDDAGGPVTSGEKRRWRMLLRDAPANPAIDEARTIEDFAKLWPSSLGAFPADAFDGWDAPPEKPGADLVVDLAPPVEDEEEAAAREKAPKPAGIDLAAILEKRQARAIEEAKRPAPEPRKRITGRRKS